MDVLANLAQSFIGLFQEGGNTFCALQVVFYLH